MSGHGVLARRLVVALVAVAALAGCGLLGNKAPVASFTHVLDRDSAPATLTLDASASSDADGSITSYAWDIAGDSRTGAIVTVGLPTAGDYPVTLTVTDDKGATHSSSRTFTISAAQPDVVPPLPAVLDLEARTDQFTITSFTLGNIGSLPLDVTVTSDAWLAVAPTSFTLPGASLKDFVVTATCSSTEETRTGSVTLTTTDPDEPLLTVPVTLECTTPPPSSFDIQVLFKPGTITPTQQAVFQQAAWRWSEVITGDLTDVAGVTQAQVNLCRPGFTFSGTVDDLLILAEGEPIDGPGNVLGSAGPCYLRGSATGSPFMGRMRFDTADLATMEANGSLLGVILHEMGHVLGISEGTWSSHGLIEKNGATCELSDDVRYTGTLGKARWHALGGTGDVPLENNKVSGTACSHWDEETFGIELMTGYIALEMALSTLTVAALDDIGYEVNYAVADPYVLPPDEPVRSATASTRIVEELLPPVGWITPDGVVHRIDDTQ